MTLDADAIIMGLPSWMRKDYNKPIETPMENSTKSNDKVAWANGELEYDEPKITEEEDLGNIIGTLMPRNSNVQIFYERYQVTGSIQVPGAGTYYMKFKNILVAEDELHTAGHDDNDRRFRKHFFQEFVQPTRDINQLGDKNALPYRFAASVIYDTAKFDKVWCGTTVAIPIWDGDTMTNLWIIDGSRFYDVELKKNPYMTNPKSPKWEGKVK